MSALEQLNEKIEQAKDALDTALNDAESARECYRNALAVGNDKAAQESQKEALAADKQAQLEADRIEVLQEQIEDAERTDNLPSFEQAEAAVHAAIAAENKIHTRLAKALEELAKLRTDVAAAHMTTHQAIQFAQRKAKSAHVDRPTYQRQRLSQAPELKHVGKIRELLHVGAYQDQMIHNEVHG